MMIIMMINGDGRDGGGGDGGGGVQCQQPPYDGPGHNAHWALWLITDLYIIMITAT